MLCLFPSSNPSSSSQISVVLPLLWELGWNGAVTPCQHRLLLVGAAVTQPMWETCVEMMPALPECRDMLNETGKIFCCVSFCFVFYSHVLAVISLGCPKHSAVSPASFPPWGEQHPAHPTCLSLCLMEEFSGNSSVSVSTRLPGMLQALQEEEQRQSYKIRKLYFF